ncbi:MAG: hypothetical protein ACYTGB_15195 [Planctomycetota bacterium]|jgi:hypothetical protein
MKFKVTEVSQVVTVTPNRIGMSEEIFEKLASEGINVHSFCAYSMGSKGVFMLQTSDDVRASKTLDKNKYDISIEDVLIVVTESKVGAAAEVTRKLGIAEVDIEYMYASSHDESDAAIVIKCRDNARAIEALT